MLPAAEAAQFVEAAAAMQLVEAAAAEIVEAAAAAMGCVIVIAPYAFARAVDELSR